MASIQDQKESAIGRLGFAGLGLRDGRDPHINDLNLEVKAGWAWETRRVALVVVDRLGAVEVDWDAVYWDAREG